MSALNPDQFFHGTTFNITDTVRPACAVDKDPSEYSMGDPGDMSEGDHAFVIRNDEPYAWHAAHHWHRNGRRPRVYETEPAADMKPGPWNKENPNYASHYWGEASVPNHEMPPEDVEAAMKDGDHQDEWGSKTGFKVKRRIDIMPGRQGTFPQVTWNRFKEGGHYSQMGYDTNHPTDDQVRYGTKLDGGPGEMAYAMHNEHENPEPKRRTGARLRAFMAGQPDPGENPHEGQGVLF